MPYKVLRTRPYGCAATNVKKNTPLADITAQKSPMNGLTFSDHFDMCPPLWPSTLLEPAPSAAIILALS